MHTNPPDLSGAQWGGFHRCRPQLACYQRLLVTGRIRDSGQPQPSAILAPSPMASAETADRFVSHPNRISAGPTVDVSACTLCGIRPRWRGWSRVCTSRPSRTYSDTRRSPSPATCTATHPTTPRALQSTAWRRGSGGDCCDCVATRSQIGSTMQRGPESR
jgi:hypothetical protein